MSPISKKTYTPTHSLEFRGRAIQLFKDHRAEYASDNMAYRGIAGKLVVLVTACAPGACKRLVMPVSGPGRYEIQSDRAEPKVAQGRIYELHQTRVC